MKVRIFQNVWIFLLKNISYFLDLLQESKKKINRQLNFQENKILKQKF